MRHCWSAYEQIPLFNRSNDRSSRQARHAPLARTTDPLSSHLAATAITASGRRDSQKREILEALRSQSAAATSMELAHAAGIDRYVGARRLPDLARDGAVGRGPMRECEVSGRLAITWYARNSL
jgi:hypothetical protein